MDARAMDCGGKGQPRHRFGFVRSVRYTGIPERWSHPSGVGASVLAPESIQLAEYLDPKRDRGDLPLISLLATLGRAIAAVARELPFPMPPAWLPHLPAVMLAPSR